MSRAGRGCLEKEIKGKHGRERETKEPRVKQIQTFELLQITIETNKASLSDYLQKIPLIMFFFLLRDRYAPLAKPRRKYYARAFDPLIFFPSVRASGGQEEVLLCSLLLFLSEIVSAADPPKKFF